MQDLGLADMKTKLGKDGEYEHDMPAKAGPDDGATSTEDTEAEAADMAEKIAYLRSLTPVFLTPFSGDDSGEEL